MTAKTPQDKIDKIYEAHGMGYSQRKISEYANISHKKTRTQLKILGLKTNCKTGRKSNINEYEEQKIYEAYDLDYSLRKIAKYAGISLKRIRYFLRKKGLKTCDRNFISKEQGKKIIKARKLGYKIKKISEYAGITEYKVRKYLEKINLDENIKILIPERLEKILNTEPKARYAVQLAQGDDIDIADILTVVYDGKLNRADVLKFMEKPSIRDFLGNYRKNPDTPIRDITEPAMELLALGIDKEGVIADIFKRRLAEHRRNKLGAKPADEQIDSYVKELESVLEVFK